MISVDDSNNDSSSADSESLHKEIVLLKQLVKQYEEERRLMALEIHDGLVQNITAAMMHLQAAVGRDSSQIKDIYDSMELAKSLLGESIEEARILLGGLRPPLVEQGGVIAAISHLVEERQSQTGPTIEYVHEVNFSRLPPILETSIYRIVQEALNNAIRHSSSERVRIELKQTNELLCVEIRDWGTGFDPEHVSNRRFGLQGIRERSKTINGSLTIESAPDSGTRIVLEISLPASS